MQFVHTVVDWPHRGNNLKKIIYEMPEKVDVQLYKLSDVAVNDGTDGKPCWIIIKDSVYNVTNYLDDVS